LRIDTKKTFFYSIVVILTSLLSGCFGYSGDGKYESKGLFLRSHLLTLPDFHIDDAGVHTFSVDGFGSYQQLTLIVNSVDAIPFTEVSPLLHVEIIDKESKEVILSKKSRLNDHFGRMSVAGKVLSETDDEWLAYYNYSDPKVNSQIIRFDKKQLPLPQTKVEYWHVKYHAIQLKWYRNYLVRVSIIEPDSTFKGLTAYLRLTSGWK